MKYRATLRRLRRLFPTPPVDEIIVRWVDTSTGPKRPDRDEAAALNSKARDREASDAADPVK